jgi:hypothetical protein
MMCPRCIFTVIWAMPISAATCLFMSPAATKVPGWYSTYWVKMLNDIEVLGQPDTNFWMKTAYTGPRRAPDIRFV